MPLQVVIMFYLPAYHAFTGCDYVFMEKMKQLEEVEKTSAISSEKYDLRGGGGGWLTTRSSQNARTKLTL